MLFRQLSFLKLTGRAVLALAVFVSFPVFAQDLEEPQPLNVFLNLEKENEVVEAGGLLLDIRLDAVKEAALSYGARGGLAWQTFKISNDLEKRERYLDRVFDFSQLLIPAPSGLLIEPPIVSESANAMLIEYGAQEAAVSDRIYHIIKNAQIVSAGRSWREYLQRDWGGFEVDTPPDILRPADKEEREAWKKNIIKGWEQGVLQADEIFEDDLALLSADFQGMVRYRLLLAQGMISPPRALQVDRGVTGGGHEMRVGDRAIQITGVPELMTGSDAWKPANR
jgi:defect-in-organelle-trafficking protein DotC